MNLTIAILAGLVLVSMGLAVGRIALGPTASDRIIAQDVLFAAGVCASIIAALATGRTVFLDVGVALALFGFAGTIGWARLVRKMNQPSPDDGSKAEGRGS